MKVALYCRVSHEDQAKFGISIDAQKDSLIKYCKTNKYTYDLFTDEGISGGSIDKRPALKEFLNKIDNYSLLLFTKLDRLSRSVKDAITINEILQKHNVKMIAIQDQYIDTSTANGEFIFNLRYALAQQERKQDSERIKSVFDYKVKVSKEVISGTKIYGYDIVDKHYKINEEEAKVIKDLYNKYIECGSINSTYKWWVENVDNILLNTIRDRLTNIKYNGKFEYQGIIYNDYIPKIIDDDTFNKVHELLKHNYKVYPTKSKDTNNYYFSGLIKCACCGVNFTGMCYTSGTKAYHCSRKERVNCNNGKYITEKKVLDYIFKHLPIDIENYNISIKEKKKDKFDNNKLNSLKNKYNRIIDSYINGYITKDNENYKSLPELKKEIDLLQTQYDEQKQKKNTPIKFDVVSLKSIYDKLDDKHKRMFFANIIERIEIKDGEVINLYLNIK